MEFKVTTDLSVIQPQSIESNFRETKEWLQNALAPYQNMVVSEDAISTAKVDRANINKLKKTLDDKRKAVKKQWLEPYTKWEEQVTELIKMCDDASGNIDTQVKKFEEAVKEDKLKALKIYFKGQANGMSVSDYVTFDDLFDKRWLNVTSKTETVMEEIRGLLTNVQDDLRTIRNLNSEHELALLEEYKRTHSIRDVLAKEKALKDIKAQEANRKASGSVKAEENVPASPVKENATTGAVEGQSKSPEQIPQKKEKVYTLQFEVELTKTQMFELKDFFESHNIVFRKISK